MNINFFGINLQDGEIRNRLIENGFENKFSFKQKLYYNFVRPVLPKLLRKKLQQRVNSHINYLENFIDASLVKKINFKGNSESDELNDELKNIRQNYKIFQYKDYKEFAIVLTHDVEEQQGFNFIPKLLELEEQYGFKSSWNIVPYKYKIDEGIIKEIKENGHEVGIHGYNHDGKLYYSEKIFNKRAIYINYALKKYDAVGFRSPQVHRNLVWLQKLDIEYDASCFDYDPFQPFPGGTGSIWPFIAGKFIELPYTLPQDHTVFYVLKKNNIELWINKITWLIENKGVVLTLTHPDYLIDKKHFQLYEELLKFLKTLKHGWHCLPRELAKWWREMNYKVMKRQSNKVIV